jgi:hypothetical protein
LLFLLLLSLLSVKLLCFYKDLLWLNVHFYTLKYIVWGIGKSGIWPCVARCLVLQLSRQRNVFIFKGVTINFSRPETNSHRRNVTLQKKR